MDDFGILARDFGFGPQGKSAPMSASKGSGIGTGTVNVGIGSIGSTKSSSMSGKSGWNSTPPGASLLGDDDGLFDSSQNQNGPDYGGQSGYDDVFGGPPRYSNPSRARAPPPSSASPFDSLFPGSIDSSKASSLPVYDKPVYDDDIFDGVPGIKSSASVKYDDVFSSMSSQPNNATQFDDLLENFGKAEPASKGLSGKRSGGTEQEVHGFDDLIPGFGGSSPPPNRKTSETNRPQHSAVPSTKSSSNIMDDPFVSLESTSIPAYSSTGLFTNPLEDINKPSNSGSSKADGSSVSRVFDNINAFDGLTKSMPLFSSEINSNGKNNGPLRAGRNLSPSHTTPGNGPTEKKTSMNNFENVVHKKMPTDDYLESHQTLFDIPTGSSNSNKSTGRSGFPPKDVNANSYESNSQDMSPKSDGNLETADDVWLTVSEIPLFTRPTSAPPPSRSPPSLDIKPESVSKADKGYSTGLNVNRKASVADSTKSMSSIDELENFVMGKPRTYADEPADILSSEEEMETHSAAAASAAAMKEAMDRAEAKFKHAREVREKERDAKTVKNRESAQQEDEKARKDAQECEYKEKQERVEREREQREREEKEKEKEKEKEQKRLEKEREREMEIERGKARQAVERATKEARDRAAIEARLRAERAAVEKANAEARERAERAAVQRAAAEARERAAAEARERAEKVAAEARQRAAAEARERAAVERAAAEVRLRAERAAFERAAAEARERAAAAAREKQQNNENDLEFFFSMGARPNSAPRQRATTSDPAFDTQFQSKGSSDGARRTSVGTSSTMRKASSTTYIVDDLASMFGGAATSAGEFQEIEGETEERRRARLERHQRTLERAKKALAEKNERDMQTQRDQAERHRIAETLDIEIKRWAAGKEGNLRALLSTLQYVLWPECGWQPVSLTDLITGASVKKVYRKATLCIHPDKVQQKGANLQQKYIAEKVFDLLKEAWNKFNSEELF